MESLFGIDMNLDGKKDLLDDLLFMEMVEEDEEESGEDDE